MENSVGSNAYAQYNNFSVSDESTQYTLSISSYSGTASDSLNYHNGQKFSTIDSDNDSYHGHCAQAYKGAWWHRSCHNSNLNGVYSGEGNNSSVHWRNFSSQLKNVKMMIK